MKEADVKPGMRIVITDIKDAIGYNVDMEYIANRCLHARGTVLGYISGHGGEVYAVEHDSGSIAVYHYSEFEQIEKAEAKEKMKNNDKEVDNRTRDEEEIAAIADMIHTLLFCEGKKKTTGVRPGKRMLTTVKQAFKKVFDLFRQRYRWYTHIRYI